METVNTVSLLVMVYYGIRHFKIYYIHRPNRCPSVFYIVFYITHIDVFESYKSELVLYCVRRNDRQAAENYNLAAVLYKVFLLSIIISLP